MLLVGFKEHDFGNFVGMFFEMTNHFSGFGLPDPDLSLVTSTSEELSTSGELNADDSVFMTVVNFPYEIVSSIDIGLIMEVSLGVVFGVGVEVGRVREMRGVVEQSDFGV